MLSISTIARVIVNASRAVSVPTSFDTGLLLIKDSNFTAPKRLKTYDSAAPAACGEYCEITPHIVKRKSLTNNNFFLPRHWEFQQTSLGHGHFFALNAPK